MRIYITFPNKCLITCRGQEIQDGLILDPWDDHTQATVQWSRNIMIMKSPPVRERVENSSINSKSKLGHIIFSEMSNSQDCC